MQSKGECCFFLSSFNLGPAGLWEAVGGKRLSFFFSYGQNHDSLWLTVLRAVETTPAKKKKDYNPRSGQFQGAEKNRRARDMT